MFSPKYARFSISGTPVRKLIICESPNATSFAVPVVSSVTDRARGSFGATAKRSSASVAATVPTAGSSPSTAHAESQIRKGLELEINELTRSSSDEQVPDDSNGKKRHESKP